jgi:predicted RecA/RadA family phage recombinase
MAKASLKHTGAVVEHTAGGTLARGDCVDLTNQFVGIVQAEAVASGEVHEVAIEGVYLIDKNVSTATWSTGAELTFNSFPAGAVSVVAGSPHRAAAATGSSDTQAAVLINVGSDIGAS